MKPPSHITRRMFREESVVLDLAKHYRVKVRWIDIDSADLAVDRVLGGGPGVSGFISFGPYGHGCNVKKRTVFFEKDPPPEASGIEIYLHELVHVIVQPPFEDIEDTMEEYVLFQFERALAKHCLEPWAFDRVLAWQHQTGVTDEVSQGCGKTLGDVDGYERSEFWRKGFARCRAIGLLDHRCRPTGKLADWSRLPSSLRSFP